MRRAIFVTGGAAGGGLAIAERFAQEGYDIILTSRDGSRARDAAVYVAHKHGVYAKGYALDCGDESLVEAVFRDIDSQGLFVQTLCLNAANLGIGADPVQGLPVFDMSADQFRQVLETNLIWNFTIVRQAAVRMRAQGKGAVVFISSNTAYRAIPNRCAYSASKGGINALSKALAVDLGPYGIRCNTVLPGTIKTARWEAMGDRQIVSGELTPIGDISDFDDIAQAVWYLGSDASKNVTGAELVVDGGMSCQLFPRVLQEYRSQCSL